MRTRLFVRVAAVVTATAAVVALAACGGPATDAPAANAAVDRNATLRVALYYNPSNLDPHLATSASAAYVYISELYDRLTQLGPELALQPGLAEKWEFSPDGKTVTFTLRDGPKFWDGTPVDAAAVKGSLERALTLPGSTSAAALSMIAGVEAVDARTVRITTKRPAADLPYVLSGVEGSIINPKALTSTTLDREPAGSGPYKVTSWQVNQRIELERWDGYWDPAAQQAKRVVITGITNDNTRIGALRSGEYDLVQTTLGQYDQAEKLGADYVTHAYPPATTYAIYLNTSAPNIDKTAVRQALNWAVDREGIAASLLAGQCTPTSQPLGPAYPGYLQQPPVTYGHDVAKARQLLADAGVPQGFTMRILVPNGLTLYVQMATALQDQLRQVGIEAELVQEDAAQLFADFAAGKADGLVNNLAMKATSGMTLSASYLSKSRFPGTPPPDFAAAVQRTFDPALDQATQNAAVEQASGIASEQALGVYLCSAKALWTSTTKVVGADTMGPSYISNFGDLRGVGITG